MRCPSLGCGDTSHHIWVAASCFPLFFLWKEDEIKVFFVVDVLSKYLLVLIIYLYILCLWEGYIWRAKLWCVDIGLFNIGISFLKIRIIGLIILYLLGVFTSTSIPVDSL